MKNYSHYDEKCLCSIKSTVSLTLFAMLHRKKILGAGTRVSVNTVDLTKAGIIQANIRFGEWNIEFSENINTAKSFSPKWDRILDQILGNFINNVKITWNQWIQSNFS